MAAGPPHLGTKRGTFWWRHDVQLLIPRFACWHMPRYGALYHTPSRPCCSGSGRTPGNRGNDLVGGCLLARYDAQSLLVEAAAFPLAASVLQFRAGSERLLCKLFLPFDSCEIPTQHYRPVILLTRIRTPKHGVSSEQSYGEDPQCRRSWQLRRHGCHRVRAKSPKLNPDIQMSKIDTATMLNSSLPSLPPQSLAGHR
jgi:hypothetical protein